MELDTSRQLDTTVASGTNSGAELKLRRGLDKIPGRVHFVGIGGIGMSALARLLLADGRSVSGSDKAGSPITEELRELGAEIYIGHKAENLGNSEAIVVSTAINRENPELARALDEQMPVFHRSEILAYLASKKKLVAVSGTHGKTTTTGMVSQLMLACGKDPSVVVGGIFAYMKSNAHAGKGEYFVAEADESDRTHERLPSEIAVVTNIETDHMENYPGGMEQILATMAGFANKAGKCVVLCLDDAGCRNLLPMLEVPVVTYGCHKDADYRIAGIDGTAFQVFQRGELLGSVSMEVPGFHNKLNGLAAIAVCMEIGMNFEELANALSAFRGVARRFEQLGEARSVLVVDDYGHHPTEVRATLEAAQQFKLKHEMHKQGRVVAVFQPHQPGRLRDLWKEFCTAFENADLLLLADIYVARGGNIEGISSERFSKEVEHKNVHYLSGKALELPEKILPFLKKGDIVLTIGAGDITNVGKPLLSLISEVGLNGRVG